MTLQIVEQQRTRIRTRLACCWLAVALLLVCLNDSVRPPAWSLGGYFVIGLVMATTLVTHLSQVMRSVASTMVSYDDVVKGSQSLTVARIASATLLLSELILLSALGQLLLLSTR